MSEQQQRRVRFLPSSRYCTHFSSKTIEALRAFTHRRWQFEFREQIGGNPLPQYGRIVERMRNCSQFQFHPSVVPAPKHGSVETNARYAAFLIHHRRPSIFGEDENGGNSNILPPRPQQSTSTEVADSQRQPCTITGEDINQGEEPDRGRTLDFGTPDRGQIRDLLLNAVADIMQEICLHKMSVKLWNRRDWLHQMRMTIFCVCFTRSNRGMVPASPPQISPTTQTSTGTSCRAMRRISADIRQLVRSRVQHVEAGQYTVDMIDLLEVSRHPHVGYSLEPYTGGPPYPSRQSAIEMAIVYLGCRIECAVIHLLGMPRPSDWPAEWYGNLRLDMEELDHLILVTISRESFSPLLPACYHAYLRCKEDQARFQDEVRQIPLGAFRMIDQISHFIPNWTPRSPNKYAGFVFPWWVDRSPQYHSDFQQMRGARIFPIAHEYFQRLSMGDRIDEWMEEKVSAYMIAARSAAGRTYGVKYIMEFQLIGTYLCLPAAVRPPPVGSEPPGQKHTYEGGSPRVFPREAHEIRTFHPPIPAFRFVLRPDFNSRDTSGWKFGGCPHVTDT
ncbi:hypothetical protein EV401DRAFT_1895745 [Pisolithus croceorrhizus]|nr:hypothetical protein EV401DRAFT_1895745 [Pisolithus croceorrhizus]